MTRHTAPIILASAIATWTALPLIAGEVPKGILSGSVVYDSQPYPEPPISSLPIGKVQNESLLINPKNGGIANVIVWLIPATINQDVAHRVKNVSIQATDTGFSPHVVVLQVGDTLQINNAGTVGQNVIIQSVHNAPINELLPPGKKSTFTPSKTERWPVSLTGSIKSWMAAWIVVSDSPHVAVSDENGRFQFRNVMPGEYDVKIWHEKAGAVRDGELGNRMLIPTAKGYKLRLETVPADLGRIAFAERQFDTE